MNHFWVYWNVPEQTGTRTSLNYRGISIASFRRWRPTRIPTPEPVLMHLIGEQSRLEQCRSVLARRFIGSGITDDVFYTRPVPRYAETFSSRFLPSRTFKEREKGKIERRARKCICDIARLGKTNMSDARHQHQSWNSSYDFPWDTPGDYRNFFLRSARCRVAESFRK